MGNLIGEQFQKYVYDQVGIRQETAGSGYSSALRNKTQLQLQNNRNAWVKLASSVNVSAVNNENTSRDEEEDGRKRLREIGIVDYEKFKGNQLAKKSVLFNTLVESPKNTPRAGVAKTNSVWNDTKSYGLGGTDFGLVPPPGIISAAVDCKNRGSIKEANIEIKCYNKFQFELLEILYLRLGYTMILEYGWDKYTTDNKTIKETGNTIIENQWFQGSITSQFDMISQIETYRELYAGNYDGFFGKVKNFDWKFNPDGSYDISLTLISVGDVIESLKTNTAASNIDVNSITNAIITEQNEDNFDDEFFENSPIVANAGSSILAQTLYTDIIVRTKQWEENKSNYFSLNYSLSEMDPNNSYPTLDQYSYYMSFGQLLQNVLEFCIPLTKNGDTTEPMLDINVDPDSNVCAAYPYQISLDPRICVIKPVLGKINNSVQISTHPFQKSLKGFQFVDSKTKAIRYGKIMNIYINYDFISKCLSDTTKKGNISIFKFLQKICDGLNTALGNINQLEPTIKNDNTITITEQNPIPGIETIFPSLFNKNKEVPFEIFGYKGEEATSNSVSNFVRDFGFETKITPETATMLTIGATANNVKTKNYDATAFSKWNIGLQDRYNTSFQDPVELSLANKVKSAKELGAKAYGNLTEVQVKAEFDAWSSAKTFTGTFAQTRDTKVTKAGGFEGVGRKDGIKSPSLGNKEFSRYVAFGGSGFTWDEYILKVNKELTIQINKSLTDKLTEEELEQKYSSNYLYYLVQAFGGKFSTQKEVKKHKGKYYLMEDQFIDLGKTAFKSFVNTINQAHFTKTSQPSNTVGFIPLNLNITVDGLAGIKIYQKLNIRTDFLPKQYPTALNFIITKVNHKISDNDWDTKLDTISVPKIEAKKGMLEAVDNLNLAEFSTYETKAAGNTKTAAVDPDGKCTSKYAMPFSPIPPSTQLSFKDAAQYLYRTAGSNNKNLALATFTVMWFEASKYPSTGTLRNPQNATGGFNSSGGFNYAGVQTDNKVWTGTDQTGATGPISGQYCRFDGRLNRAFAVFRSNESFLDWMLDRVKQKRLRYSSDKQFTNGYIDRWWSPKAKKFISEGTLGKKYLEDYGKTGNEVYKTKLSFVKSAKARFNEFYDQ